MSVAEKKPKRKRGRKRTTTGPNARRIRSMREEDRNHDDLVLVTIEELRKFIESSRMPLAVAKEAFEIVSEEVMDKLLEGCPSWVDDPKARWSIGTQGQSREDEDSWFDA